jgi:hypothetical protein
MTPAAPPAFPGSRTLVGWWRQLAPWQPRAWWVGHLLLHRVEALARCIEQVRPDPLHQLVLKALSLDPEASLDHLAGRLHLDRQVLGRVTQLLQVEGLVGTNARTLTAAGQLALNRTEYPRAVRERRTFTFVEPETAGRPPAFVALGEAPTVPWPAESEWQFNSRRLSECVSQTASWKQSRGFPTDVEEILLETSGPDAWRRVVVDRPERLAAVLVHSSAGNGGDRLLGFAVRQDGWTLHSESPLLTLGAHWPEVLPQLVEPHSPDTWLQAWRAWCQSRNLANADTETVGVHADGYTLRVQAAPRLLERLRSARNEALKGEVWLLAGNGRMRPAALLEVVEAK